MRTIKLEFIISWRTFALAVLIAVLTAGIAFATVAGTGSRWNANALEFQGSSGNDAFAFKTNGLRAHFGTGASDYCSSDGTTVSFAGPIATTGIQSTFFDGGAGSFTRVEFVKNNQYVPTLYDWADAPGIVWVDGGVYTNGPFYARANNANVSIGTATTEFVGIDAQTGNITTHAGSGNNILTVATNGARLHFGSGASDYATSDGTTVTFAGPLATSGKMSMTSNSTTCTLNGGNPATCTATVTASAVCTASIQGTTAASATAGIALSLSATTLTVTSGNGHTEVVNILCDR